MTDQNVKENAAPESVQAENSGEAQPNYATVEQVNAAITARNRELTKELASLKDLLSRVAPPVKAEEPKPETNKAEIQSLKTTLAEMQKAKEEADQKRMNLEMRDSVKSELAELGIKPGLMKAAMASLIDADKTIAWSEEGNLVFKDKFQGEMDLKSGLKQWAKSAEAKEFLAPKGSKGSGDRSYNSNKAATNTNSDEEAKELLVRAFTSGRY